MLLLAASSVALVLLVVHSWRRRGRAVTLTFFIAGMLFGIVRGNVAWLVMYSLTGHPEVTKPYLPQGGLLPAIGHASFQVAAGWVFSLYLAWTISELILRRLPRLRGRVFVLSALASLFMLLICYCMETTAVTTGWWYWTMPTRSALYGNVNKWAMRAWFSVAHDFLMPFLIIVCSTARRRRLRWLWLAAFPLHKSCHFLLAWTPLTDLVHHVMALFVVALMLFSKLRMERGEIREPGPPGRRAADVLPGAALIIFFLTLTVGNVLRDAGAENFLTLVPLLMFSLLAWRRLPVWVVLGLSVVAAGGWFWIGARALYALAPVGVYGFLALQSRLREPLWSKLATLGVAVASRPGKRSTGWPPWDGKRKPTAPSSRWLR